MRRLVASLVSSVAATAIMVGPHGAASPAAQAPASAADTFTNEIRPILERSCWKCHGETTQLSKLDLRSREAMLQGGTRGPALVPGRADQSRLYRVLAGLDKPAMPMGGSVLGDPEIAAVRRWIDEGAHWDSAATATATTATSSAARAATPASTEDAELPSGARDYWAFRLPVQPPVPAIAGLEHPIDRFLERARRAAGVTAAPHADRRTLVRRAYLDLIGLPPIPDETEAFLADTKRGAWERLIERLLASPHYGERWGRHWLDVARYADSHGYEQDYDRPNAWRYRDYVIDAFNRDKPYNQFIKEQIAGDELDYTTDQTRIATGFLRAGPRVMFREKDNPERRYDYLDDLAATIGRGVLGLTVHCARCHDHKFDPILQKDYYRLQASLFGYVETDWPLLSKDEADAYRKATAQIDARLQPLRSAIAAIEKPYRERLQQERLKAFPAHVQLAVAKPERERTAGERLLAAQVLSVGVSAKELDAALIADDTARRKSMRDQIAAIEKERPPAPPMAEIVTDGDYRYAPDGEGDDVIGCPECRIRPNEPGSYLHDGSAPYDVPPSYFLIRGDPFSKGARMSPGFVSVATVGNPPAEIPRPDGRTSGRRLALAEWLASHENPLPARVMVNRIWHHHFGRGIVATLDNFGQVGDRPTHPELLDWLATEFVNRGWSMKEMHRLIMTSDAYQMASAYENARSDAADPENRLLWRFRQQRLEAEIVRDAIMSASAGIDLTVGGPPVFPHVPDEVLKAEIHGIWRKQPDGPSVWRRSVYVYRRRSLGYPFFDTFDLPSQNQTAAARNVSTVPTQALTLLNNPFVLEQAQLFADRLTKAAPNDVARQIDLAYRIALTRPPTAAEVALATELVAEGSLVDFTHVVLNLNEFVYLR